LQVQTLHEVYVSQIDREVDSCSKTGHEIWN
jgi:hypothetical protein